MPNFAVGVDIEFPRVEIHSTEKTPSATYAEHIVCQMNRSGKDVALAFSFLLSPVGSCPHSDKDRIEATYGTDRQEMSFRISDMEEAYLANSVPLRIEPEVQA